MGGSSKTEQTTQQADNRNVLGPGSILAQGGSSVAISNTSIDAGAIGDAFSFARSTTAQALDSTVAVAESSIGSAHDLASLSINATAAAYKSATSQALGALDKESQFVAAAYSDAKGRGAMTDKITLAAIVISGLVAFAAVRGKV